MSEPVFVTIDTDAELAALVSFYETQTGRSLQPSSVEYLILSSIAYGVTNTKSAIQDTALQGLVDFAVGTALEYRGANVGVTRLAASAAITDITFTLDPLHTGVTIPQGTRVASTDGGATFVLVEDTSVASGVTPVTVSAECEQLGTSGNGYAIGAITNILDPQAYLLTATNPSVTEGGAEKETDTALRTRIKLAVDAYSTAGPSGAYKFHALSASASIIAVGVDLSTAGQVDVYPLMADGSVPGAAILSAVEDALDDEKIRPLSDTVVVAAPTAVAYDITAVLTLLTGANGATIQTGVEEALAAFAVTKRSDLGLDLIDTQIHAAVHGVSSEIYDVTLTGWSDISIAATEYGLVGTITVTIGGYVSG